MYCAWYSDTLMKQLNEWWKDDECGLWFAREKEAYKQLASCNSVLRKPFLSLQAMKQQVACDDKAKTKTAQKK